MPGKTVADTVDSGSLCKRCGEAASHKIRFDEVCSKCFTQYVNTKAIKRMETYKIRASSGKIARKLLLPLSFGACSASLLHILDQHLQGQYDRMKRTAYELYVVHVNFYLDLADRKEADRTLENYRARFPRHTYSTVDLEDALLLDDIDWNALNLDPLTEVEDMPATERLQKLLGSMSSATSRADIVSTLLSRLLVDISKKNNCEGILFGDTTTRLAEKTLTETAKGRGFSLPWQISDGAAPCGITFNYPLRDILKKEVSTFSSLSSPPLTDLIIQRESKSQLSASSKLTTIDDLMSQYFESVEENFPSIVANVVRTTSKLQPLPDAEVEPCGLCGLPVVNGTDGIHGWGGDQNSDSKPFKDDSHGILCYGCSRSINS